MSNILRKIWENKAVKFAVIAILIWAAVSGIFDSASHVASIILGPPASDEITLPNADMAVSGNQFVITFSGEMANLR
jgi:hypothetical protein